MEAATAGLPLLPAPPPPNAEKIEQKLLRRGVVPTPKIIHTIRKKELQKLRRREAKEAARQSLPTLTDSQKQALSEESQFKTIKSEYKGFTNAINGGKKMVGRPWERLERLKLRELASENKEYRGEKLKTEHLRELGDIMESERQKLQWLLDDDVEVDNDGRQSETRTWAPHKRCQSEAEAIRGFLERLGGSEPSVKDWKFSRIMKLSGLQFTERQMLKIVEGLGESGKWRHALSVVEWVYNSKKHRQYKRRFVYTKLLAILGKARRPNEAIRIFNFMRGNAHIYPDMAAYHSVAVALGQAGLLKELLKIIDCMKEKPKGIRNMRGKNKDWEPQLQPDVVIFNAVLNACVSTHEWKGVSWVFEQLRKNGVRPNGATYGLAMEVMLESGKYELVHEFFSKMKRSGVALQALTYKVLVKAFWKEGKVSEAIQAVRDMEGRGIIGAACVYYELACCLCFHGRWEEAIMEVEKLKSVRRTRPLEVTFTGMILSAMDGGNVNVCLALFEHCKRCFKPDIGIINAMLKVCARNDMFLEAKQLFEGTNRDKPVSGISLNDWGSSLSPDIYTFGLMLEVCASAMQWEYFEYVYKDMTLHGYQLDQVKHGYLLVEASRAGKWQLLEHAFDTILEAGGIPHRSFFMEMLCQAVIKHDREAAAKILNAMAYAPFQVSEQQWMDLFKQNGGMISGASLKELSDSLCSTHSQASEATILNLSRVLLSLYGSCSSSYSLPERGINWSSDDKGNTDPSDAPGRVAGVSPAGSLQVTSDDDTASSGEEGTQLEQVSLLSGYSQNVLRSDDAQKTVEHHAHSCASIDSDISTFWTSNSTDAADVEYNDLGVDVDRLNLEVPADGEGDSGVPSADEILKSWQEMRRDNGTSFSFQLSRKQSSGCTG